MGKKNKLEFKFLALMVIICFLLSCLIFLVFDTPSSTTKQNSRNTQNEIIPKEIERLELEEIPFHDLEKMLNEYNKKQER